MDTKSHFDYVVVDCSNLAWRSWWNNRLRKTSKGAFCGLEYGFIQSIMKIARGWYPARLVLVWDGEPVRGLKLFPWVTDPETGKTTGYKADRKESEEKAQEPAWDVRLENLRERFKALVPTIYHPDYEADEQITFFVKTTESYGLTALIISNDEDLHQLVSPYTFVLRMVRGRDEEDVVWGVDEVRACWKVSPEQLPLRWAVEGDGSIPGVPRMPKAVVVNLVNRAGTLEGLFELIDAGEGLQTPLQVEKMRAGKEVIAKNYELFNLGGVPYTLTILDGTVGDSSGIKKLCKVLEMHNFVDRREWNLLEEDGKLPLFIVGDVSSGEAPVRPVGPGDPG